MSCRAAKMWQAVGVPQWDTATISKRFVFGIYRNDANVGNALPSRWLPALTWKANDPFRGMMWRLGTGGGDLPSVIGQGMRRGGQRRRGG